MVSSGILCVTLNCIYMCVVFVQKLYDGEHHEYSKEIFHNFEVCVYICLYTFVICDVLIGMFTQGNIYGQSVNAS